MFTILQLSLEVVSFSLMEYTVGDVGTQGLEKDPWNHSQW